MKTAITILTTLFCAATLHASDSFSWTTVAIGGGGFVSSIVASPVEPNLFYARTDVGGAYRWDNGAKRWISMMDWVDLSERGLLGIEAIVPDPKSADKLYMVAGTTYWNEGRSAFLRSTNRGASWEVIYTWDTSGVKGAKRELFSAHGNGMGRGNGEALAIDPLNPSIMFYGSKCRGLFRSTDNGSTWRHVDAFTEAAGSDTTWNGSGFSFVTFAPGRSDVLYAGFLRSDNNVFTSTDGGVTWSLIANRIKPSTNGGYTPELMPQRVAITSDGKKVYITFGNGAGPHTMAWDEGWGAIRDWFNRGAILMYQPEDGQWFDVSPENFIDPGDNSDAAYYDEDSVYIACYGGISINPDNPLELVASSIGYRAAQFWYVDSNDTWKDQWGSNIYYSSDGGASWTPSFQYYWMDGGVYPTTRQMDENGIGWMASSSIHWAGCALMDPFNPKRVIVTSGNGVFATEDITAFSFDSSLTPVLRQNTVWKVISHGIEEVVPEEVVSIPGGPLISVIGDYDGFRHDDITEYPYTRHPTNVSGTLTHLGSTRALAYAPKTGRLVKAADARSVNPTGYNDVPISPLQFSDDSGRTWSAGTYETISADYKKASCAAISADGQTAIWTPSIKTVDGSDVSGYYPVQRYANSAWSQVAGIDGAFVVGDPEDADIFYAYTGRNGSFYRSTDKGITFVKTATPGTSERRKFRVAPQRSGDIWIPLGINGLIRSIDGGATFSAIPVVTECEAVGFGRAADGKSFPAVYIYGTVEGVTGVFQSIDEATSWNRINDDAHEYGGLANGEFVIGDANRFGVVYMSTAGRGIACRVPSSMVESRKEMRSDLRDAKVSWRIEKNVLHIYGLKDAPRTVSIYSLSGRRLFHCTYSGAATLPLRTLLRSAGACVITIGNGRNLSCRKIISIEP